MRPYSYLDAEEKRARGSATPPNISPALRFTPGLRPGDAGFGDAGGAPQWPRRWTMPLPIPASCRCGCGLTIYTLVNLNAP